MSSQGYIYIASNPSFKSGIIKIGKTQNIVNRMSQLYSTGVPNAFKIEYKLKVDDYSAIESKVHEVLDCYRYNKKREFFTCTIDEARLAIEMTQYDKTVVPFSTDFVITRNLLKIYKRILENIDGSKDLVRWMSCTRWIESSMIALSEGNDSKSQFYLACLADSSIPPGFCKSLVSELLNPELRSSLRMQHTIKLWTIVSGLFNDIFYENPLKIRPL